MAELDIAAFLRARLDEREAVARACTPGPWRWGDWSTTFGTREEFRRTLESSSNKEPFPAIAQRGDDTARVLPSLEDPIEYATDDEPFEANAQHIIDNDPAFVLADVAAKRQIIEQYENHRRAIDYGGAGICTRYLADELRKAIQALALPFAGHPDYRKEWKP